MSKELPKIKFGSNYYYLDVRLQQLRAVNNPHNFIELSAFEIDTIVVLRSRAIIETGDENTIIEIEL